MALLSRYSSIMPRNAAPSIVGNDMGKTRSFLPSLNYPGSSSRGASPITTQRQDYPAIQAGTGKLISGVTGLPWTGPDPRVSPTADPNDPNRYQPLEVIKSPAVAAGANVLMDSFKQGADTTAKGWTDFFNEAKAAQGMNREAFNREQQSFNVQPLANDLRRTNAEFAIRSRDMGSRYADVDADYEANQRRLTQEAYDVLPQYDAAAQAIADRQFAANAGAVSRYKAGSGTPTSLGSSELRMLNRAAADVYLPLHREQIARRMGLITDLEMPLEREYTNRDTARLADEYGREQYLSERNADTEKQIKQLELSVAGMSRAQAESYIRSLGLPMQIQQEILARHIANLGGIGQLEESSRYRGLQDTQGMNLSPTVGYTMGTGTYPTIQPNTYRVNPNVGQDVVQGGGDVITDPLAKYPPKIREMLIRNRDYPLTLPPSPGYSYGNPSGGGYVESGGERTNVGTYAPRPGYYAPGY